MTYLLIFGLFFLIAIAIPIAAVLALLGLFIDFAMSSFPLHYVIGETTWAHGTASILVAIPLFILMGELLLRSGIADRMYTAALHWLSWLPGSLMHTNIVTSTIFAATSGSSVATAATVGTVAIPQIRKHGYNSRLFLGSLAAGGTLGILVPPSINMIIYAVLTDTSVPQLFLAGFLPGILLAAMFMLIIAVACFVRPDFAGEKFETNWSQRRASLPHLVPPLLLFMIVIGSIYAGWATPTEAAAMGTVAAMGLAAARRRLNLKVLHLAFENTVKTTAMILLILTAAYFLNFAIASVGIVDKVNDYISGLGISPLATMLMIIGIYLVLGCVMDVLAMMVLTLPIAAPIVFALGYDPVWFGIIIMVVCEAAQITPPIGMVGYVVQTVRGEGPISDVFIGIIPFLLALLSMFGILLVFPDLALWLPTLLFR